MEAGRAWARPARQRSEAAQTEIDADTAFFGLTVDDRKPLAPREVEIWEGHLDAINAWRRIDSQWRTAPAGLGGLVWIGLDYAACRTALDLAGITITPDTWAQVQMIEAGARQELNRREHR